MHSIFSSLWRKSLLFLGPNSNGEMGSEAVIMKPSLLTFHLTAGSVRGS